MATVNWNVRHDDFPSIQGGLDGGKNHIGQSVPFVTKLSQLSTTAPAAAGLKLPKGVVPKNWALYVVENNLAPGVSATVTLSGQGVTATCSVAGYVAASGDKAATDPTAVGPLASGLVESGALVTSDTAFVAPKTNKAINPATDGDAIVALVVGVEVVDRSKVYLW